MKYQIIEDGEDFVSDSMRKKSCLLYEFCLLRSQALAVFRRKGYSARESQIYEELRILNKRGGKNNPDGHNR